MKTKILFDTNSGKMLKVRLLAVLVSIATTLFLLAGCGAKSGSPAAQPDGSSADITEIAKTYVDHLAKGEFEAATSSYDNQMKAAAPADTLKQLWEQLTGQLGAFQQQVETHTGQVQGYQAVYVTSQFEKGKIDIRVVFNSQGQISGMQFVPAGSYAATP